jgi:uncharacterized protein (TIGR02246 family)
MKHPAVATFLLPLCFTACATTEHPDLSAAAEAEVRAAVKQWNDAAAKKNAAAFAGFYTEDAVLMLEDGPDVRGRANLAQALGGMMSDPAFALSFAADTVIASRSGDLAYETGHYALTTTKDGKPATERGQYVVVWRRQADGSWKVAVDAPVSDAATPPPQ